MHPIKSSDLTEPGERPQYSDDFFRYTDPHKCSETDKEDKRVIVTPAVYPRLVEFLHFDIQSTTGVRVPYEIITDLRSFARLGKVRGLYRARSTSAR